MDKQQVKLSRRLSKVLRHAPESAGLTLDANGWVRLSDLCAALSVTEDDVRYVVDNNDKKRFVIEGYHIRAQQGHTVDVDLDYEPKEPPETLYHGTTRVVVQSIRGQGLLRMKRTHVHLSADVETARRVATRHHKVDPIILSVRAKELHSAGGVFFQSGNGVWLIGQVPPRFIDFPEGC